MSEQEARLYVELLDVAFGEGQGSEPAYDLGRELRDKYFPGEFGHIFDKPDKSAGFVICHHDTPRDGQ